MLFSFFQTDPDHPRKMAMDGQYKNVHIELCGRSVRDPLLPGAFFADQEKVDKFVKDDSQVKEDAGVCQSISVVVHFSHCLD